MYRYIGDPVCQGASMKRASVTIRDVAKAAGVSPMAVSKALHGRGCNVRVSPETAERIRRVAKELDYHANSLARSLRSRRTHTIGLIFEAFGRISGGSQYMANLLDGLCGVSFEHGYNVTLCPRVSADAEPSGLYDGRFDGVVWAKFLDTPETRATVDSCRVPVVFLHAPSTDQMHGLPCYSCDNAQGVGLGVRHLADLGHRRMAFVIDRAHGRGEDRGRWDAFRASMASLALPVDEDDLLVWDEKASDFMSWWWANPPHTALFCWSEYLAGAVLEQAAKGGVRVPEELSVIGFDSTAFCDQTTPRLTAVSQPIETMARDAGRALVALIEDEGAGPEPHVYACALDVRDSTSHPKAINQAQRERHEKGSVYAH